MTAEPTLRDRLNDVEDLQALVVALMRRVDTLEERMPTGHVWVVMHDMEPWAVFKTEAEAEALVRRLLPTPDAPRIRASSWWMKLPIS